MGAGSVVRIACRVYTHVGVPGLRMSAYVGAQERRAGAGMAISDDMFRKVATAAYDLHRHRQATTFAHWLVRVLARTIACDSAMLVSVDVARRHFALASSPAVVLPLDEPALLALHARDHPFVAKCAVSRSASAFRLRDLCAAGEFAAT